MATSTVLRRASYGLELIDALTGGPLVGRSAVTAVGSDVEAFVVNDSRWVFEGLAAGHATFQIVADLYVPARLSTGTAALPDVPPTGTPGILAKVFLLPRTGYPFPPTLTRVVGRVRLDPSIDPLSPPVAGAKVTITAKHGVTADPDVVTFAMEDGQYTYWFFPNAAKTPPLPDTFSANAVATVNGIARAGSIPAQSLVANVVTGAPPILLL